MKTSAHPQFRVPASRCLLFSESAKSLILTGSVAAFLCAATAVRADQGWDGDADQNWSNPANWSNNTLPSNDNAYVNTTFNFPVISFTPTFTPRDIYIGTNGNTGRLDQTAGAASTGNGNWLVVGLDGGTGTFNLNGGTMTTQNSDLQIGRGGGSNGTVNVSGSGTLNVGATLDMGDFGGNATLSLSGGTVNANGETWVDQGSGGSGTINISGGVFNANNYFVIGRGGGTNGSVTLTGGSLVKNGNGQLIVGDSGGAGVLNLNGGTATAGGLYNYGTGTVNFGGGTLQANAANSDFIASSLSVNVNAGGGTIDSNGNAIGTSASIFSSGGGVLTKAGGGTFTLGGNGDNISLGATVAGGTLVLGKASNGGVHALGGDLTVNSGATAQLGGSGGDQIFSAASVTVNGTFDTNGRNEGFNGLSGSGTVLNSSGTASVLTVGQNSGSSMFTGVVSNANGGVSITKTGNGTLTVNSATANGFAPSQVNVSAGTLLLGGSNKVGDSTAVTLSGGTLATGGNSEGAAATGGAGLGALTLSATSTLDFGAGSSSIVHFAGLGTHAGGTILTITNWDGIAYTGEGTEALLFDGVASDFTSLYGQGDVTFNGVSGYAFVQFSGYYEITAVPEPTTLLGGAALAGLLAYRGRRRWLSLSRVG